MNEAPTVPYPYEVTWDTDAGKIKYATHVAAEELSPVESDPVNSPSHYTSHPSGVECKEIIGPFTTFVGAAIKYLWRAGLKSPDPIEDLRKAMKSIEIEIERLEKEAA
ncbi:DUF3310 domain-containing protein [Streptomyces sp. NBC_00237]|uniref:DUF3310 domain-containing protein n=1 Tax=Streptomyces sp. NBC_00237 TaxID=2975687 RepID=UPI00225797EF|nr:DUF3310 domain-containing protein [Streptomyces sp. NBC_00237]MCX5201506.1 DUF3310 domain-containing protein [Streptomyces sp. NBC_00237]